MSATNVDRRPGAETPGGTDPQSILAALEDEACRAILGATANEPMTALELANECDVPTSTTYRKVETLAEAGLLEERVRINVGGKHATEYRTCFEDVTVAVDEGGDLELEVSKSGPRPSAVARGAGD